MNTEKLNDSLADLLDGPVATEPRTAVNAPADYKPNFEQKCKKCGGSGQFRGWSGRTFGPCFACKGAGKLTFKTSPEARAKNRASAAARKVTKVEQNWADFAKSQPEVAAWIEANPSFGFATDLRQKVEKFGDLLPGALAAVHRLIEKEAARVAERTAREAAAPVADAAGVQRLHAAFDAAKAYTQAKAAEKGVRLALRSPRITIGGVVITPAKADSKNAGALYVKAQGTYLGKIMNGKFMASRDCGTEDSARVLAFVADPKAAAEAYGQETGVCCVCNATLKSKWRERGIGPVCAEKFGW